MKQITKQVEQILSNKPFIQQGLLKGIMNVAALSEEFIPEIEANLKTKINFSSVNMAIRRYAEKLEKADFNQVYFEKTTSLNIKSNLMEITIYKNENVQNYIKKLYKLINMQSGDFLTITQGLHEVMIIFDEKYKEEIIEILPKKIIKYSQTDIASLTMSIPQTSVDSVGFYYTITKTLAWENVPIIDIVSTYTEITILLSSENVGKSFDVLKKLISNK